MMNNNNNNNNKVVVLRGGKGLKAKYNGKKFEILSKTTGGWVTGRVFREDNDVNEFLSCEVVVEEPTAIIISWRQNRWIDYLPSLPTTTDEDYDDDHHQEEFCNNIIILDSLPDVVLIHLLSYINDFETIRNLMLTSTQLKEKIRNQVLPHMKIHANLSELCPTIQKQYHYIKDICVLQCKISSLSIKLGQRDFDLLTLILENYMDVSCLEKLELLCTDRGHYFVDFNIDIDSTTTTTTKRTSRTSRKASLFLEDCYEPKQIRFMNRKLFQLANRPPLYYQQDHNVNKLNIFDSRKLHNFLNKNCPNLRTLQTYINLNHLVQYAPTIIDGAYIDNQLWSCRHSCGRKLLLPNLNKLHNIRLIVNMPTRNITDSHRDSMICTKFLNKFHSSISNLSIFQLQTIRGQDFPFDTMIRSFPTLRDQLLQLKNNISRPISTIYGGRPQTTLFCVRNQQQQNQQQQNQQQQQN